MRQSFTRLAACVAALLATASAEAIDFRSVTQGAVLFDAPSPSAKRLFVIAPGTPVEVVVENNGWVKVRDPAGAITWIEASALSSQRTVMVSSERAVIRQRPEAGAPAAFEVTRAVVLELKGTPVGGWVEVAHRDGLTGFIRVTEVWGL